MNFESMQGMLLVCGEKDHRRQVFSWQSSQNLKPVHARHLHVQKHNVGSEFENLLDCGGAVGALPDDLDILEPTQPKRDTAPRQRLVVDDQRAHTTPSGPNAALRNGSSSLTSQPPVSWE